MAREACSQRRRRRKCCICRELFHPDPRNYRHQRACSKASCQKARKGESQRRWLAKPKNRHYFRGAENVSRVQQWRQKHPDYWKGKTPAKSSDALQDLSAAQLPDNQPDPPGLVLPALQDLSATQPALIVGLISQLIGSTLQDDIAQSSRGFILKGCNILGIQPSHEDSTKDSKHEGKEAISAPPGAPSARAV